MKHTKLLAIAIATFAACTKMDGIIPNSQTSNVYVENIKKFLRDNLSTDEFGKVNIDKMVRSVIDSGKYNFVRIPFKDKSITQEFILLNTDRVGNCHNGIIVDMVTEIREPVSSVYGSVAISDLKRQLLSLNKIVNGRLERNDGPMGVDEAKAEDNELPEVIVTGYYPREGADIEWYEWIDLVDLYGSSGYIDEGTGGTGVGDGYYSPLDPYDSTGFHLLHEDGNASSDETDIPDDEILLVEYENPELLDPIDINAYMKCFESIPDAGSECSIEIFTDLPVDGQPNMFFDWSNGSPGHTFLQIKKSNGTQLVQQNIGFYPEQGWKTILTPAPVNGKFADNQGHDFNASFKMQLTPEQLKTVINEILYLSGSIKYDIDENNCTDFALHVFNIVRPGNPIEIPKYDIPGGMAADGTETPQGLYQELSALKAQGGTEASAITIPGIFGWVGASNGPCY